MKYGHVSHTFYNTPWALLPESLTLMDAALQRAIVESKMPKAKKPKAEGGVQVAAGPPYQLVGRTAMIPVFGVLAQRMGLFEAISGGTSTESIGRAIDAAVNDHGVRSILLVIDSPGGSVFGVQELGTKIAAAKDQKKIVAIADSLAASAAYWIASQCTELVVTPGGQVGSVGVLAAHRDESKAEEIKGVKTTLIHAGKYKVEGDPSLPLSAEARDNIQELVDKYYTSFVNAVAKGRGVTAARVEKDFGQGRMKLAKDAVEAGMADRIATREQVLQRLGADAAEAARASARAASYQARAAEIGA